MWHIHIIMKQDIVILAEYNDETGLYCIVTSINIKVLDDQVNELAAHRINEKQKGYSEKEVFGPDGLDDVSISDDDGWE